MINYDGLSRKELAEVYYAVNSLEWDDRLGEKPEGFDEMPCWDNRTMFSRSHHLKPIYEELERRTSEFDRLRAWHLTRLKRSKAQFYRYWVFRRWCGLRRI